MDKFRNSVEMSRTDNRPVSVFFDYDKTMLDHKAKFLQFINSEVEVCAILQKDDGSLESIAIGFIRFDDVNGGE